MPESLTASFPIDPPYDLAATLSMSALGLGDPCLRQDADGRIRYALTRESAPLAFELSQEGETVSAQIEGDGVEWARKMLPDLLGVDYKPPQFDQPSRLRVLAKRWEGLRLIRAPLLFPRIVQTVLQQLVSYQDACHGWRELVMRYGTPISGHDDLSAPPSPERLAQLASFEFVECGILPEHGRRIVGLAKAAKRIEAKWESGRTTGDLGDLYRFLESQRGIGPWTMGFLRGAAMGDGDAVVLRDYGLPKQVAYFFEGVNEDADDDEMLRLLEPFRPHRFYVLSLLIKGAPHPPRRGPRRRLLRDHMGVRRRRGR